MSCMSERGKRLQNFNTILSDAWLKILQDGFHKFKNPTGIINLGMSENKLMYDVLKTKFEESCDIEEHHTHYCDFGGLSEFKRGIADLFDHMMKPVEPVDPSNLLILNGCCSVVEALTTVLTDPVEGILIPSPYYGGFDADLSIRAQAVPFPVYLSSKPRPGQTQPFELTVDQLERAMKDAKEQDVTIRCLLLTNPNNPLGNIYSAQQLQSYLDFAHRHTLHVILDEIYTLSIFKEGHSMKSILSFTNIPDRQRLHVVWGFSKDFGISGFRCGVLHTWNKQILDALKWVAYFQSVPTSTQVNSPYHYHSYSNLEFIAVL
ncbi:probable inactive 1-aminocyclopropane-1-carboxylate synthase-like protein 2 [Actinia tenebrosa]|uniref:Probable inactive 1-aminocyclopropane-1-carboxylate synthase-like protein 2 n=1 Tax=Actinia tenebrosa TaxID=6105 RepID=A0A6P8IWS1_ACTTE|nr:probable inactive 1-aminocyclopropane-1-carboxylate synthase-like protein 2 [Actinia tenebrosa]